MYDRMEYCCQKEKNIPGVIITGQPGIGTLKFSRVLSLSQAISSFNRQVVLRRVCFASSLGRRTPGHVQ